MTLLLACESYEGRTFHLNAFGMHWHDDIMSLVIHEHVPSRMPPKNTAKEQLVWMSWKLGPVYVDSEVRKPYSGKHGVAELLRNPSIFETMLSKPNEEHVLPTANNSWGIVDLMLAAAETWRFTHTPVDKWVGEHETWALVRQLPNQEQMYDDETRDCRMNSRVRTEPNTSDSELPVPIAIAGLFWQFSWPN